MENTLEKSSKTPNILSLISLGLGAISVIMTVLGTTLTCACSAKKSMSNQARSSVYTIHAVVVITIIGIVMAIAACVLAIVVLMRNKGGGVDILAVVALAVSLFGLLYGILPLMTLCSYNCSLNDAITNRFS